MSNPIVLRAVVIREVNKAEVARDQMYTFIRSVCRRMGVTDYNVIGWLWYDIASQYARN